MKFFKENISKSASKLLLKDFEQNNILFVMEELEHDGYDKYGPKSNLWDLLVISNKDGDYVLYKYHKEDWYGDKSDEYELIKRTIIEYLSNYEIELLFKNILHIENEYVINNIIKLYKKNIKSEIEK
jgi:hypothetical protein